MEFLELANLAAAFAGSAALGFVKSKTRVLDGKIGGFVKPIQPLLVYGAAVGLPLLASKIGLISGVPDAAAFIDAPLATLFTISAREGLARFKRATSR